MSGEHPHQKDQSSLNDYATDENVLPLTNFHKIIAQEQIEQAIISTEDSQLKELTAEGISTKQLSESIGAVGIVERSLNTVQVQGVVDTANIRKGSLVDCEICCEEVLDDEEDIRRKINQKLIKNKNYFMDFMAKKEKPPIAGEKQKVQGSGSNQSAFQLIDKRSRSETPDKMSATEVLFRAHKKLQMRRKQSPSKLLEKHQQRQKKAEELRAQIENSKKNWYEKIKIRQQVAKEKWKELLAERKAKLQEKMELADERRETEIQSLKNKAKQEIQKIDETNYIFKMTMNNMKLDLYTKMNETQERRNQILEEHKRKQHDRHLKEEAAEKRRQELHKESEEKFLRYQMRQEQAEQRRLRMLEQKKRHAMEYEKRIMVQQRKNDLGDKISDVMSFVSNSENIWDFLETERDWQELGLQTPQDENLYEMLTKDHFEFEKLKLKMDQDLLNQIIVIDDTTGQIYARKEYLPLLKKRKPLEYDSSNSDDDIDPDREIFYSPKTKLTPSKLKVKEQQSEERKRNDIETIDNCSDGSEKDSIAEETSALQEQRKSFLQMEEKEYMLCDDSVDNSNILTEEAYNYILYSNRIKMSMKRNVLKKNLSEDLTWADFLKNESYENQAEVFNLIKTRRSMQSTPERKSQIPSEHGKDNSHEDQPVLIDSNSSSILSNSNSKKGKSKKHKNHMGTNSQGLAQNTSSSSNISEKSRISSVVYPSQKKKNPKNQNSNQVNDVRGSGSFVKQKTSLGGSNQSSTQSLIISNSFIGNQDSHQKDTVNLNPRKSLIIESDSARKRQNARMHSSSVQESSGGPHTLGTLIRSNESEEKFFETQSNASITHTGSQMNQLITNSKPILQMAKVMPKKLTANAIKLLFPLTQQKLLFKRPGKEGQFGKCKLTMKIEDLLQPKNNMNSNNLLQQQVSFTNDIIGIAQDLKQIQPHIIGSDTLQVEIGKQGGEEVTQDQQEKTNSNQNTPGFSKRKDSTDTNNSSSAMNNNLLSANAQSQELSKDSIIGTPTQQSKLWLIHQKFWEKSQGAQPVDQNATTLNKKIGMINTLQSETSQSPKKEGKLQKQSEESNTQTLNQSTLNTSQNEASSTNLASGLMNEQGYKELIIKYLLIDNISYLKTDDTQKTIFLEGDEANKLIDYLESNELQLRYCRLCDLILPDHSGNEAHMQAKSHKKTREELGIKESEDLQFSILQMSSYPGDIEKELLKEKEKALKRKVKRLKAQMIAQAVSHETASYSGKELLSQNKKRFQILCIELEKQVIPTIKDYETLESDLKEIIKILDMRKQADLHLMRRLKFIPILIEICKRISVCHKNEFKNLGHALEYVIKIINIFCSLRENRNYMLQTNRMQALIELLNWCLNRPTQLFYGITFMPQLFHILTLHIKHRAPYECQQMREMFIEYLISSQITMKIKSKFQIINGPLDLSEMMGQVPLFLLKSCNFLETLTAVISLDSRSRPVYEKSEKIAEHVLFVVQNTELFGIIPMIATILLTRNQPFKPSSSHNSGQITQKLLPQTILSLAVTSIKIINNVYRMDYRFAQQIMSDFEIQEQLYHLFNYILFYAVETADKQEDSKELLHETLLLMGYFCLNNEKHQAVLFKGENTLLQKLCNLPFPYFCDKKLKEILFPTLIQASYKNDRSLAIMDQEISIEMLVDFIQFNLKEELPRIIEEEIEYQSMSSVGHSAVERKSHRSPSISSTNSSQCSLQIDMINGNSPFLPLYMRFPKKLWREAITFYSKVLQ